MIPISYHLIQDVPEVLVDHHLTLVLVALGVPTGPSGPGGTGGTYAPSLPKVYQSLAGLSMHISYQVPHGFHLVPDLPFHP